MRFFELYMVGSLNILTLLVLIIVLNTYRLQNELCRMRFDVTMLDELVREYCVYRGIVDSGLPSSSGDNSTFSFHYLFLMFHRRVCVFLIFFLISGSPTDLPPNDSSWNTKPFQIVES